MSSFHFCSLNDQHQLKQKLNVLSVTALISSESNKSNLYTIKLTKPLEKLGEKNKKKGEKEEMVED